MKTKEETIALIKESLNERKRIRLNRAIEILNMTNARMLMLIAEVDVPIYLENASERYQQGVRMIELPDLVRIMNHAKLWK